MNNEKLQEVYKYLKSYIIQKEKHPEYIDYYSLYNINPNSSLQDINKDIKKKKIRVLFHPDQVKFVDESLRNIYLELSEKTKDIHNIFSKQASKDKYDQELENYKAKEKIKNNQTSTGQEQNVSAQDEANLERALETTIYKLGFYQGLCALNAAIIENDFKYFTRDNNSRELVKKIGYERIRQIVYDKRKNIMEDNANNVVMDYFCSIIEKTGIKEKADKFHNACLETAMKYDVESGLHQLEGAVDLYIKYQNPERFTNRNRVRKELKNENLSSKDAYILLLAKLHSCRNEDEKYSYDNVNKMRYEQQVSTYSDMMIKNAKKITQNMKAS